MGDLAGYRALSFDCYGTLIDWEQGIADELGPWAAGHGIDASRDELVEVFARFETEVQHDDAAMLYPGVLGATLARIASHYGVQVGEEERASFGASVGRW